MFSERGAIPRTIEYEVDVTDSGQAVGFDEREATASFVDTRSGIVRSVEVGAFLSVDVAERLHQWLGEKIAEAKALG